MLEYRYIERGLLPNGYKTDYASVELGEHKRTFLRLTVVSVVTLDRSESGTHSFKLRQRDLNINVSMQTHSG